MSLAYKNKSAKIDKISDHGSIFCTTQGLVFGDGGTYDLNINSGKYEATVVQGEFIVCKNQDINLKGILGSCVSIWLTENQNGIIGVSHYQIPGKIELFNDIRKDIRQCLGGRIGEITQENLNKINRLIREKNTSYGNDKYTKEGVFNTTLMHMLIEQLGGNSFNIEAKLLGGGEPSKETGKAILLKKAGINPRETCKIGGLSDLNIKAGKEVLSSKNLNNRITSEKTGESFEFMVNSHDLKGMTKPIFR